MQFEVLADRCVDTFHPLSIRGRKGYFLLPVKPVKSGSQLFVRTFDNAAHLRTNFYIGSVGLNWYDDEANEPVAFLFYSTLPVMDFSTSILSYSGSWRSSVGKVYVTPEQTNLVFKSEHFYVYEAPTIATLVTTQHLSDRLNGFLTML